MLTKASLIIDDPAGSPTTVLSIDYIGPYREERRTFGNDVETDYTYTGYDGSSPVGSGFGHVTQITATFYGSGTMTTETIDSRGFTWDASGNRTTHNDLRTSYTDYRELSFAYDSADRLIQSVLDFDAGSSYNDGTTDYALDGVYNRTEVSVASGDWSGAGIGTYTMTDCHAANNQYTTSSTPRRPGPGAAAGVETWVTTHDRNGNLVLQQEFCPTDFNGDGSLNILDVAAFTDAWNNQQPEGDWNGDGNFDILDVVAFNNDHNGPTDRSCEVRSFTYDYRDQLIETTIYDGGSFVSRTSHTYDALKRRTVEELDLPPPETAGGDQTRAVIAAHHAVGAGACRLLNFPRSSGPVGPGAPPRARTAKGAALWQPRTSSCCSSRTWITWASSATWSRSVWAMPATSCSPAGWRPPPATSCWPG